MAAYKMSKKKRKGEKGRLETQVYFGKEEAEGE